MSTVLVITASPSPQSRTSALAGLVAEELRADGHDVTFLDLKALPAESLLLADTAAPEISAAVQRVLLADAVVVATPVYKAAYSGLLKTFLDLLPQFALQGKVVLPLATGGTVAHVLAIDYALRPVLSALGAGHVTPGWFVIDKHIDLAAALITDDTTRECLERVTSAFRLTLDQSVRSTLPAAV